MEGLIANFSLFTYSTTNAKIFHFCEKRRIILLHNPQIMRVSERVLLQKIDIHEDSLPGERQANSREFFYGFFLSSTHNHPS
jgi:hypothetical protein